MISAGIIFMEYNSDQGTFSDLPFERIFSAHGKRYPKFSENIGTGKEQCSEKEKTLCKQQELTICFRRYENYAIVISRK